MSRNRAKKTKVLKVVVKSVAVMSLPLLRIIAETSVQQQSPFVGSQRVQPDSPQAQRLLFSGPLPEAQAAAPSLPRLTMPGAPFPGWAPQGEAVLGLPVLQRNVPGAFLQGLCSGVFASCLNKCHSGLKNGLVSEYRKTGQIEVILANPAHLCL